MLKNKQLALLSGALAIATSQARAVSVVDPVQIGLNTNRLSSYAGNQLYADLTSDGVDDIDLSAITISSGGGARSVSTQVNGGFIETSYSSADVGPGFTLTTWRTDGQFAAGGVGDAPGTNPGAELVIFNYLNPIVFTDSRINGGAPTEGWLQVRGSGSSGSFGSSVDLAFTRLIFDQSSTTRPSFSSIPSAQPEWVAPVPEPSALGLLALSAVGLMRRRR